VCTAVGYVRQVVTGRGRTPATTPRVDAQRVRLLAVFALVLAGMHGGLSSPQRLALFVQLVERGNKWGAALSLKNT
jgi:hypothetical protein